MTQLAALHYGAIPVVARVSGIADTVSDADPNAAVKATGTGIQFAPVTLAMLENAIARASALYRQRKIWRQLQINGMATDVSWDPRPNAIRLYSANWSCESRQHSRNKR